MVEKTKDLVYDEPCLLVGKSEETDAVTPRIYCGGRAEEGRGRWQKTRSLLQVLSRYFQRPTRKDWTRPTLLSEGKHGRIQCIGEIPLNSSLFSGALLGATPRPPHGPRVRAWNVGTDGVRFIPAGRVR